MTEDEMVRQQHELDRHEFEQAPGLGDGQGSLVYCIHGVANNQMWLSEWTTKCQKSINLAFFKIYLFKYV